LCPEKWQVWRSASPPTPPKSQPQPPGGVRGGFRQQGPSSGGSPPPGSPPPPPAPGAAGGCTQRPLSGCPLCWACGRGGRGAPGSSAARSRCSGSWSAGVESQGWGHPGIKPDTPRLTQAQPGLTWDLLELNWVPRLVPGAPRGIIQALSGWNQPPPVKPDPPRIQAGPPRIKLGLSWIKAGPQELTQALPGLIFLI